MACEKAASGASQSKPAIKNKLMKSAQNSAATHSYSHISHHSNSHDVLAEGPRSIS